jgi:DNA-binding winged helix-turn-helix (wHTH) protein
LLYIFDNYALDPDRRELRSGATAVAMEPQAFDLLLHLIRRREHVVSRDELIESIWGGRIVSESALSTRINAVRNAIGDNGTEQRLIKTLPRKGIRFVGEVREECKPCEVAPANTPDSHAWKSYPPPTCCLRRKSRAWRRSAAIRKCWSRPCRHRRGRAIFSIPARPWP